MCSSVFVFFKQKTAYEMRISDWSSTCALPICEEQILGDLLRNGGCPDRTTAMSQVRDHRRDDAGIIQAMMLKQGAVLSRHIGTDQQRWIIGILKLDATFARVALHGLAIGSAHNGGQGRFIGEQRRGVGQIERKKDRKSTRLNSSH